MPSRGVQDYEEYKKKKQEEREKQKEKLGKWCRLAGLTIIEFILCFICAIIAYAINVIINWKTDIKFLILPIVPCVIATVYLALTLIDFISWFSVRPITYYAWLVVSTSGFLMFMIYVGVNLFHLDVIPALIAVAFGTITALVFLGDTICCFFSLKRFPIPHWILKRKFEKLDECVCTGDYVPEEEEVRPLCRCGNSWGEPCTCDDTTCGCVADKMDEAPCPCCECGTQALVVDDEGTTVYGSEVETTMPRKSILTTGVGSDYMIDLEPRKSRFSQSAFMPEISPTPQAVWCTDRPESVTVVGGMGSSMGLPPRKSIMSQRTFSTAGTDPLRASYIPRKSMQMSQYSVASPESRKSLVARKSIAQSQSQTRKSTMSRGPSYSVYTATVDSEAPTFDYLPSILKIKRLKSPIRATYEGDVISRKSVNLSGDAPLIRLYTTADDEVGEGDYSRRNITPTLPTRKSPPITKSLAFGPVEAEAYLCKSSREQKLVPDSLYL